MAVLVFAFHSTDSFFLSLCQESEAGSIDAEESYMSLEALPILGFVCRSSDGRTYFVRKFEIEKSMKRKELVDIDLSDYF